MSLASQTFPQPGRGPGGLLAAARPILADLGGTLAFYLIYLVTGSPRLGAAIGLALGVGQLALAKVRGRKAPALLVLGVVLTAILGGMTFVTQDPRFLLLKPSLIYALVGLVMLRRDWLAPYLPSLVREVAPPAMLVRAGRAWAGLMFATALLNLVLVAALPPMQAALALTVWATGSKLALFAIQYVTLRRGVRRALSQAA